MASKHLKPENDYEVMETPAREEEEESSNESSSEEDKPTKEKEQKTLTPPSSVVSATETKKKKKLFDGSGEAQPSTKKRPREVAATETKQDKKKKKKVCGGFGEAQPSTKKRPSETTSKDDVSDKRLKNDDERLEWSEEDEMRVLQGILNFQAKTGKNLILDKNGTYEFVKKTLSVNVSSHQFLDKIYGLKKKYFRKLNNNGKELSFSNAHNQEIFELSKLINWGNGKPKRSSERIKKLEEDKKVMIHEGGDLFFNSFLAQYISSFGGDEVILKRKWSQVTVKKKKMVEDKWRVLLNKEFAALAEKTKLLNEVVSAIVEASTH